MPFAALPSFLKEACSTLPPLVMPVAHLICRIALNEAVYILTLIDAGAWETFRLKYSLSEPFIAGLG